MSSAAAIQQQIQKLNQQELELWLSYVKQTEQIQTSRQLLIDELLSTLTSTTKSNSHSIPHPKSDFNDDDFDVILNLASHRLRYRQNPDIISPLRNSNLNKIGVVRIQLIARMLDEPGELFHTDRFYRGYGNRSTGSFTKAMGEFRKALGQKDMSGPYLIKQCDSMGLTHTKRGCVYRLNPQWRYLVIRNPK